MLEGLLPEKDNLDAALRFLPWLRLIFGVCGTQIPVASGVLDPTLPVKDLRRSIRLKFWIFSTSLN
jgi:hypothetical protein